MINEMFLLKLCLKVTLGQKVFSQSKTELLLSDSLFLELQYSSVFVFFDFLIYQFTFVPSSLIILMY